MENGCESATLAVATKKQPKTRGSGGASAARTRPTWPQVLGALEDAKARSTGLAWLASSQKQQASGGQRIVPAASLTRAGLVYRKDGPLTAIEAYGMSRSGGESRLAREAVCNMLSYVEDWLEYEWPKKDRSVLAGMRRQLEEELWP